MVQLEPWLTRDKVMIDFLKTIGIEKGKPFNPDAKTKSIFDEEAREARAEIDVWYEKIFVAPFDEGTHWALPAYKELTEEMPMMFANPDRYPVDYWR
jgi:hypothetical protein